MGVNLDEPTGSFRDLLYGIYSFFFLGFCFYLYLATEIIDLVTKWGDIEIVTFSLCYVLSHVGVLFKKLVIFSQRTKVRAYCKKLESGYFLPNYKRGGSKEYHIISEAVRWCNMQTYIFYTLVIAIVGNRCFYAAFAKGQIETIEDTSKNATIVKYTKVLPYTTWLPFDTNADLYYELAFIYQMIGSLFYGLLIGTCDSFVTGFLVHIKSQLLILKDSLESYVDRAVKEAQVNINTTTNYLLDSHTKLNKTKFEIFNPKVQMLIKKNLKECIKHHQEIIHLAEDAELLFNYLILIQFLASMALLCLSLFQLTLVDIQSTQFFSMIFYVGLRLFQLLIFCWNGDAIQTNSLDIATVIYNSKWTLCDTQTQKMLIPVMQRAQRPLQISAGKFAYLTLETYMNILRASVSYYMVLQNVSE